MHRSPGSGPSLCEREPIHIPGAIQPHGAVLAALADVGLVTHASANLLAILGRPAEAVLGRPLAEAVGEAAGRVLLATDPGDGPAFDEVLSGLGPDGLLHLHASRSGRHICVDIERSRPEAGPRSLAVMARSTLETFKQTASIDALCQSAVRGLKALTGYDRVMAYRFGEDGHGEVIAEARAAELEPYLGLRYPASDIPPQARRLYLRQSVGAIADSSYRPAPLLVDPTLDDGMPLDLTFSTLRSISPIHREYMRNMKTAASLTIALAHGQDLWGMLVCHHATPRVAGPELRAVADIIGQVVSLLLVPLGEAEVSAQRLKRAESLRALAARLGASVPLPQAFAAAAAELLDLVNATGAIVRLSGALVRLGRVPPPAAAEQALAVLWAQAGGRALAIDDLGPRYPECAGCIDEGSGALLLPLTRDTDDAILWFRPELPRTVVWGGNPGNAAARLSPRTSFAAWRQTMRGHSAPWAESDLAIARDLRAIVAAEMARRGKAELARFRHLAALGHMASGMAHELNTPLAVISMSAENTINMLLSGGESGALVRKLKLVIGQAERASKILRELQSFASGDSATLDPSSVADAVDSTLAIMRNRLRAAGAIVSRALPADLPRVLMAPAELVQVLTNLIVNACDACVRTGAAEREIRIAARHDGAEIALYVADRAGGVPEADLPRIFEPFFTTKSVGQGTGLGLSICHGFLIGAGGSLSVRNEDGGAVFEIRLPADPAPASAMLSRP